MPHYLGTYHPALNLVEHHCAYQSSSNEGRDSVCVSLFIFSPDAPCLGKAYTLSPLPYWDHLIFTREERELV